jgi:hypothetical protein
MPIARSIDEARDQVRDLVERFGRNLDHYKRPEYLETRVRVEFVDPFFQALGWDVHNTKGYAELYKDVVHEDAIRLGEAKGAPDYSFRIGGTRKFFLEAKKPAVAVRTDVGPAYQLRRYAWSARLPLSVLTDFEELALYDCQQRPAPRDGVAVGRVELIPFDRYLERFDQIYRILARESVLQGSFDRYVQDTRAKRGTGQVDVEFLKEIEGWREALARNLALRNGGLSVHELNFAVQHTIDRILFLRIAEDRGIEIYGRLLALAAGRDIYPRLVSDLFRQADEKYNSGLFDFERDRLSPALTVDDRVLKPILTGLYYPESPYEFSVLPVEVLGQVYEQFLGKVIRLTPGHVAKVEEKPEVRKAGGVYYTPAYIVDYIVRQTVGRLVEGKGPRELRGQVGATGRSPLRVLDPACGSGSFLLGAYQFLLDHYRRWYEEHDPAEHARGREPAVYQGAHGEWRLTTAEKKRILLDHIYGVDIDRQAVEVTKLSLLLKVLEGESEETVRSQLAFWHERALPDLGNNCKCGNSLIGPDYFEGRLLPDEEEMRRVNPLDWQREFPAVFSPSPSQGEGWGEGGFDVVIGNPPYVRQETLKDQKVYFERRYQVYHGVADLYTFFIERSLTLLRPTGLFGMIVSNKWLRAAYGQPLRAYLTEHASVIEIADFAGLPVFPAATVRTIVVLCSPTPGQSHTIRYLAPVPLEDFHTITSGERIAELVSLKAVELPVANLSPRGWSLSARHKNQLVDRMREAYVALKTYSGAPYFGVKTGLNEAYIIDSATRANLIASDARSAEVIRPIVGGRDVRRYGIEDKGRYLIWMYIGVPIRQYPAVFQHLRQYQAKLEKRWDKGNHWWELRACDYYDLFAQPKIIYPDIAVRCRFALDHSGLFGTNTTYFIPVDDLYLLGLLNSRLGNFYFTEACAGLEGGGTTYLRFFGQYLETFPIRTIDFSNPADVARHDRMVALVEQMLDLHKKLAAAAIPEDRALYERRVESTDQQIDALVYELYGLTGDEIAIVEGVQTP